jgi:N-acetylglucosamine-6-phosphate deacetylase
MIVLIAHRLFTPLEEILDPLVFLEDGLITRISSRAEQAIPANATVVDFTASFPESILAPGLLDIHMHGGAGVDVMRASPDELSRLHQFLATHGVTGYFPTTVAAPLDATCLALERIANSIEAAQTTRAECAAQARPLGIHLEGPFLSHLRRGVHPPQNLLHPTVEIFDRLWQAARGHIRMMTIAPELPGAIEVIAHAAHRSVLVSLGHSDADLATARAAIAAGARHATHTFNAMRPLDHRQPGIVGEILTNSAISADIIADGIHLAPEIVQLFLTTKGKDRSVLITDAISATGMPDGSYQLGPIEVEVKDGKCLSEGRLAGSVLTMDRAVQNVMQFAGWNLREAVGAASLNPAHAARLALRGEITSGSKADFVVLDYRGKVLQTIVGGRLPS